MQQPETTTNDPSKAGHAASDVIPLGDSGYSVMAIHSTSDSVDWLLLGEPTTTPLGAGHRLIRQEATFAAAVAGLPID